jgi:hypothetical protein
VCWIVPDGVFRKVKDLLSSCRTRTIKLSLQWGGDLQPGCLANRLLTGLGQPHGFDWINYSQIVWQISVNSVI